MNPILDAPVKAPTFEAVSLRRRVTNKVAAVLVSLAVLVA